LISQIALNENYYILGFLILWGVTIVGDSPQFSTLNAQAALPDYVGSALTITASIGFFITILSIQLLAALCPVVGTGMIFLLLLPGPVFGLLALRPLSATLSPKANTTC
jgi:hypothetical protein